MKTPGGGGRSTWRSSENLEKWILSSPGRRRSRIIKKQELVFKVSFKSPLENPCHPRIDDYLLT